MISNHKLTTRRTHQTNMLFTGGSDVSILDSLRKFDSNRCMLIIDENVYAKHNWFVDLVRQVFSDVVLAKVPSGETFKSYSEWKRLIDLALTNKLRRGTPVLSVGGGVTGDLAGFVAASVLRGLPLIQVPTTLLAMVDSSIGGKTGINHATGKNLIGAFYQPELILFDMRFMDTLPVREWNCGLGEVLKYACIRDESLFDPASACKPGMEYEQLSELVQRCAAIKSEIVSKDELESGVRAFLNFGHTYAHALEAHTGFTRFAHGEAVYVGLIAATAYSQSIGAPVNPDRLYHYRNAFSLKTENLKQAIPSLIAAMFSDKKIRSSSLRLVLLRNWGEPELREIPSDDLLRKSWELALDNAHFAD